MRLQPLHGWNAVAWEIVVVMLGVLLALAAQQWIDDWTWRARAADSTARIKKELETHYTWSVEWRMTKPCIVAQIDRLGQRIIRSGDHLEPAPVYSEPGLADYVLRLPSKTYDTGAWTTAISDGVVPHLKSTDRLEMSFHYAVLRAIIDRTALNDADYQRLFSLSRPMPLDASVRFELLLRLDEMRGRAELMDLEAAELIGHITNLRAAPSPAEARKRIASFGTYRFCRAHGLPMKSFEQASAPGV